MALTYGFFDSVNGDRNYNANTFSAMFDGLVTDGVYKNVGSAFTVTAGVGFSVNVGTGKAWFNHTWTINSTLLNLEMDVSDLLLPRIDMVYLTVDTRNTVRRNSIGLIQGEPNVTPTRPTVPDSDGCYHYPLAYIQVPANSSAIQTSNITTAVGTSACPYISAQLTLTSINSALQKWQHDFDVWFAELEDSLSGIELGALREEVQTLEPKVTSFGTQLTRAEKALADIKKLL